MDGSMHRWTDGGINASVLCLNGMHTCMLQTNAELTNQIPVSSYSEQGPKRELRFNSREQVPNAASVVHAPGLCYAAVGLSTASISCNARLNEVRACNIFQIRMS